MTHFTSGHAIDRYNDVLLLIFKKTICIHQKWFRRSNIKLVAVIYHYTFVLRGMCFCVTTEVYPYTIGIRGEFYNQHSMRTIKSHKTLLLSSSVSQPSKFLFMLLIFWQRSFNDPPCERDISQQSSIIQTDDWAVAIWSKSLFIFCMRSNISCVELCYYAVWMT